MNDFGRCKFRHLTNPLPYRNKGGAKKLEPSYDLPTISFLQWYIINYAHISSVLEKAKSLEIARVRTQNFISAIKEQMPNFWHKRRFKEDYWIETRSIKLKFIISALQSIFGLGLSICHMKWYKQADSMIL